MGLVAALVLASVAVAGDAPTYSMPQTWDGPTASDLYHCANMARELTDAYSAMADQGLERDWQERWVTCEIRPSDDDDEPPLRDEPGRPEPAALRF